MDLGAIESPYNGYVYIPDTAFLYALIDEGLDTNGDGLISYGEAEAVTSLDVSGENWSNKGNISDLSGIEAFINLDTLDCSLNEITSLDFSNNISLEVLNCYDNSLSSLDLLNNVGLLHFDCQNNPLTHLNISNNDSLVTLDCSGTQLTSIDVSNKPGLLWFAPDSSPIFTLDLLESSKLKQLWLFNMPNLTEVCVWTGFSIDSIDIDKSNSPGVCFQTDCDGSCNNVGIKESLCPGISIYPNPTNSMLTIESAVSNLHCIDITSLNGQSLFREVLKGTTHQIDLSSFQRGVYFITIRSKDFVTTRKIIKL